MAIDNILEQINQEKIIQKNHFKGRPRDRRRPRKPICRRVYEPGGHPERYGDCSTDSGR